MFPLGFKSNNCRAILLITKKMYGRTRIRVSTKSENKQKLKLLSIQLTNLEISKIRSGWPTSIS